MNANYLFLLNMYERQQLERAQAELIERESEVAGTRCDE